MREKMNAALKLPPPPEPFFDLPDAPRHNMCEFPYVGSALLQLQGFFSARPDFAVVSRAYVCRNPRAPQGEWRYPDILVVFAEWPDTFVARNGYVIEDWGKPPDFALEVASVWTGEQDCTTRRDDYERLQVPEYFRFDWTGGVYHDAPLAGDRLVDGAYEPIPVERVTDGSLRCYSERLGLYVCWDESELGFWDPRTARFLLTPLGLRGGGRLTPAERDWRRRSLERDEAARALAARDPEMAAIARDLAPDVERSAGVPETPEDAERAARAVEYARAENESNLFRVREWYEARASE